MAHGNPKPAVEEEDEIAEEVIEVEPILTIAPIQKVWRPHVIKKYKDARCKQDKPNKRVLVTSGEEVIGIGKTSVGAWQNALARIEAKEAAVS